jgi:hypothetical protein
LADNAIFTHPDGMSPMQNMFLTDINNFHTTKQMPAVGLHYCVIIHEHLYKGANSVGRKCKFHTPGWHVIHAKHVFGRHKQFSHNTTNAACEIAMVCHDA